MPFKHACFISYRHGQGKLVERIVDDLFEALSNELELFLSDRDVYIDKERLKGGMFFNDELARALCTSACMVVVFTPTYFHPDHDYCAREYKAMEQLEAERLQGLSPQDASRGLIIPIVFRGERFLPAEIRAQRQFYNFGSFLLSTERLSEHPQYASIISEIAEYIADRCLTMEAMALDPCQACDDFVIPDKDVVKDYIQQNAATAVYPGNFGG